MTHFPRTMVLLAAYALVPAIAHALELAPLPIQPTPEQIRAVALLSPFAEPIPTGMTPEDAKRCIRVFTIQGRWPIRIEYEDGSQYWGEVSEIGLNAFKLLNRKTDQELTLSYAGIRGVEIAEAYGAVGKYSLSKPDARRRLPRPEPQLSPEQAAYKLTVQKLGVDNHRFVHVDLPKGKVRTGVITQIEERGFVLKDGIIFDQWISYADLQAAPRQVAAVGTRIGQGLKWTALGIGMVAMLPLFPLLWVGLGDC